MLKNQNRKNPWGGGASKLSIATISSFLNNKTPFAQAIAPHYNRKSAFTLAEVLITLAIIGVVAALTIPTVVRNYTEKQTVVQVKKAYSQLNSAFQMATVNNGGADTWDWGTYGDGASTDHIVQTYFVPYLKIMKNCGTGEGCWSNVMYKNLGGNKDYGKYAHSGYPRLLLADGTSLSFFSDGNPGCVGNASIRNSKP